LGNNAETCYKQESFFMQIQFLNAPEFSVTDDGRLHRRGNWLLTGDKDNTGDISLAAREWAGNIGDAWRKPNADGSAFENDDSMSITAINCKALDSNSCIVTFEARGNELKLIEVLRSEEIVSTAIPSAPEKLYIWRSLWRATAGDQAHFESMLGQSAVDWTHDERTIVSKITPRRISDCEFEYQLEARYPETIAASGSSRHLRDHDLPNRKEYYTRVGEMRFSPRQCGYRYSYNGHYCKLKSWQSDELCPLNTSSCLPLNWVNQPVKLLEIVEVTFLSGTSAENLEDITGWFTESRISSSSLAGVSGSFLRYDLDVDDVTDYRGREWTRITKVYRKAPGNYSWNQNYWV